MPGLTGAADTLLARWLLLGEWRAHPMRAFLAIAAIALQASGDTWPHLIENVLPGALRRTALLLAGVGALTLLIGTGTAWLVTMYRFPGRNLLQWLLLLPLAIPTPLAKGTPGEG